MLYRTVPRVLRVGSALRASSHPAPLRPAVAPLHRSYPAQPRTFTSSAVWSKGLQPDSEDPKPSNPQKAPGAGFSAHVSEPSPLTPEQYYEYSEHYFNVLLAELEKAQEEGSDIEAEYSVSEALWHSRQASSAVFLTEDVSRENGCIIVQSPPRIPSS